MTVLERIKYYIESKGDTVQKLEKKAGMSNGSFASQLKKGKTIGVDKLENILTAYPQLNPHWVLTEEGEMEKVGIDSTKKGIGPDRSFKKIGDLKIDPRQLEQTIPLYDITGTAGMKSAFDTNNSKMMPIDYLKIPNMPKCDFAMYMTGDSMYPALKAGDILAVKEVKNKQNIIWGQMYVVSIVDKGDEYLLYKYVQKSERKGYITLVSENKHHQPVEFPIKSVQALGLIKVAVRFNTAI